MDELTTSIVGIDFPNEDASKSNRRMECMMCAPGDLVELRLEPTNPFDSNAVAIFSDRGTQLGYVSAEARAPDWQADEGRRRDRGLPGDARERGLYPDPVRR
ncbi:HIRAN domain-containing protein [Sphingomonas aurantiaca]|uniref:HIRAN domain-containing protein n=1 Tax=Sphingomonas aurantiaca TaxID=185949 RepID=UPI002FE2F2A2